MHGCYLKMTFWELTFWEVDNLGVDILGADILGVDFLKLTPRFQANDIQNLHVILIYYKLPVSQRFQQQFQYYEGVNSPSQVIFLPTIISRYFHLNGASIIICYMFCHYYRACIFLLHALHSAITIEHASFLLKRGRRG